MGLKKDIIKIGEDIGFNLVRFYKPEIIKDEYFERWIKEGYYGDMEYLKMTMDKRLNPFLVFSNLKTIISCAVAYNYIKYEENGRRIAAFALFEDYHKVLKRMLKEYLKRIKSLIPEAEGKVFVDTGPVFEKEIAVRCGIGFRGKNTLVINRDFGSFFVLGEIFINIDIEPDGPVSDDCGECDLCIKACPKGAIFEPYKLDPRKCISYITIEKKIKDFNLEETNGYIYGCDECQVVCPYNSERRVKLNIFSKVLNNLLQNHR